MRLVFFLRLLLRFLLRLAGLPAGAEFVENSFLHGPYSGGPTFFGGGKK